LEEIAVIHCRFEQIHPLLDGNGPTGRLILNLLLVRLGYPPASIYKTQRTAYLRALRRADQGEPGALGELITRAVLDNLYKFVVPAVAGPARLVPIAALANRGIGANALRAAAVRGSLQATKGPDGQWRSTRDWVNRYLANRYRPGLVRAAGLDLESAAPVPRFRRSNHDGEVDAEHPSSATA
jgi:Fic/DOC family